MFNEWYIRDSSRKVKKAIRTRNENGAHYGAFAPLGYMKDPEQVGHLIVDEETRWIIEKIYALAVQGMGPSRIANTLMAEKIPTPSWYNFQRYGTFAHVYEGQPEDKRYQWSLTQIKSILRDENYIGNSVHNRERSISFKDKRRIRNPKEEWWVVKNTHEAIIDQDTFDRVQELIASRRRKQKDGTTQIFSGLLKCPDCGWSLCCGTNRGKPPYKIFHCSKYCQGLHQCSAHYVRYDVLYSYVLSRLQYWIEAAHQDEKAILEKLSKSSIAEQASASKRATQEKKRAEKRFNELNNLIAKIYEDHLNEKINERTFLMLSEKYQKEQDELEKKIEVLTAQLDSVKEQEDGVNKWMDLIKQFSSPTELTAEMLNTLIEKILVHNAVKDADGHRTQEIEIIYRFVGKID